MSVEATDWVWKHSQASGNDLIILLKIADNANADGGGAYPGVAYLSKAGRISRRAVYDCLRRLKTSGELVEETQGGGRGRKTVYRVVMGAAAKSAEVAPKAVEPEPETVRPTARNGADSGVPYKEEPSLTVLAPPSPTATEPETEKLTAQTLLGEHIDALGYEPATKGQLAAVLKRLLVRQHIPPEVARAALNRMRERGLTSPAVIAPLVDEVRQRPNGQRNGNGHYPPDGAAERERQLAVTQAKLAKEADSPRARRIAELSAQAAAGRTP